MTALPGDRKGQPSVVGLVGQAPPVPLDTEIESRAVAWIAAAVMIEWTPRCSGYATLPPLSGMIEGGPPSAGLGTSAQFSVPPSDSLCPPSRFDL